MYFLFCVKSSRGRKCDLEHRAHVGHVDEKRTLTHCCSHSAYSQNAEGSKVQGNWKGQRHPPHDQNSADPKSTILFRLRSQHLFSSSSPRTSTTRLRSFRDFYNAFESPDPNKTNARLGDVTLNPKGHYHKKFTHYASGLLSVLSILGRIGRARSLDLASADVLVPVDSLATVASPLPPLPPPSKSSFVRQLHTHTTHNMLSAATASLAQDLGRALRTGVVV